MRAEVQKVVDEVNAKVGPVEQIKKFKILPEDLSQETGELTPTLKVKRNVVNEKFADVSRQRLQAGGRLATWLPFACLASNDPQTPAASSSAAGPAPAPSATGEPPGDPSGRAAAADNALAAGLLAVETVLCLSLLGARSRWPGSGSARRSSTHRLVTAGISDDPDRLHALAAAHRRRSPSASTTRGSWSAGRRATTRSAARSSGSS